MWEISALFIPSSSLGVFIWRGEGCGAREDDETSSVSHKTHNPFAPEHEKRLAASFFGLCDVSLCLLQIPGITYPHTGGKATHIFSPPPATGRKEIFQPLPRLHSPSFFPSLRTTPYFPSFRTLPLPPSRSVRVVAMG